MPTIKRLLIATVVALAFVQTGAGQDETSKIDATLDFALATMTDRIAAYLEEKGKQKISVASFDGGSDGVSAGRLIQAELTKRLQAKKIEVVKLGAEWKVRGSFQFDRTETFGLVVLKGTLVDRQGTELHSFRQRFKVGEKAVEGSAVVTSMEDIVKLFGASVDLTEELNAPGASAETGDLASAVKGDKEKRSKITSAVESNISKPKFVFASTSSASGTATTSKSIISAKAGSDFRIELLIRPAGTANFVPVPIEDAGGFALAALAEGDTYKVKVYNDTSHDVGVKLTIDGINCLDMSQNAAFKKQGAWVVGARSSGVIGGWHRVGNQFNEFVVAKDTSNLGLPAPLDIGTITAMFFHAWGPNEQPPKVELLAGLDRSQLRTGVGPQFTSRLGTQRRFFGKQLLSSISIRYSNPTDLPVE